MVSGGHMTIRRKISALTGILSALCLIWAYSVTPGNADNSPEGVTILTVAGAITLSNREPFNEKRDGFFKHHDIEFEKAYAFDLKMLDKLPQSEVKAHPPQLPGIATFKGPSLSELLAVLKPEGQRIKIMSLDGFAQEFALSDMSAKKWIVATRMNGKPLAIGQQGPLWVLYPPARSDAVTEDEEGQWPWAVFFMMIE